MRLVENRKIAWVVLAICVVLSVCLLGGAALGRERGKVLKVFNEGTDASLATRHSMDAYLDSAAECAQIMVNEAEMRQGESAATARVKEAAATLANDDAGLDARAGAYTTLKSDVETLYNGLYNAVSTEEFRDFKLAYNDFWGYDDMLGRDEYHKLARGYNDLISGIPGGLVAGLTRQGALNTFGG